jgi:hypothetical protein
MNWCKHSSIQSSDDVDVIVYPCLVNPEFLSSLVAYFRAYGNFVCTPAHTEDSHDMLPHDPRLQASDQMLLADHRTDESGQSLIVEIADDDDDDANTHVSI